MPCLGRFSNTLTRTTSTAESETSRSHRSYMSKYTDNFETSPKCLLAVLFEIRQATTDEAMSARRANL